MSDYYLNERLSCSGLCFNGNFYSVVCSVDCSYYVSIVVNISPCNLVTSNCSF